MKIGEVAAASGVSPKMVRYYEAIKLIHAAKRRSSGYRQYDLPDVHRLRFIRMARNVGISLTGIRELLALWDNPKKSSAEIKMMALAKIAELQRRLRDVDAMIDTLQQLARSKKHRGKERPGMGDARAPSMTPKGSRKRKP